MEHAKFPTRFKLVSLLFLLVGSNQVSECLPCAQDLHNLHSKQRSVDETSSSLGGVSNLHNIEDDIFSKKAEFEDGYIDDEIDPALKEMLDR